MRNPFSAFIVINLSGYIKKNIINSRLRRSPLLRKPKHPNRGKIQKPRQRSLVLLRLVCLQISSLTFLPNGTSLRIRSFSHHLTLWMVILVSSWDLANMTSCCWSTTWRWQVVPTGARKVEKPQFWRNLRLNKYVWDFLLQSLTCNATLRLLRTCNNLSN